MEPYGIVYDKELNIGKLPSGTHNLEFVVNGKVIQSRRLTLPKRLVLPPC